jgi:hypothetical protein
MMQRLAALLLIPVYLIGGPLPHSHCVAGPAVVGEHSGRPHVHLGGLLRHGGVDARGLQSKDPATEESSADAGAVRRWTLNCPVHHDADALYLTDLRSEVRRSRWIEQLAAEFSPGLLALFDGARPRVVVGGGRGPEQPSLAGAGSSPALRFSSLQI